MGEEEEVGTRTWSVTSSNRTRKDCKDTYSKLHSHSFIRKKVTLEAKVIRETKGAEPYITYDEARYQDPAQREHKISENRHERKNKIKQGDGGQRKGGRKRNREEGWRNSEGYSPRLRGSKRNRASL